MTPTVKLGKKLGVVEDPRTIRMGTILEAKVVAAPATHRIASTLHEVPMFANDRYGDCTCASQAHRVVTQERSAGQARREIAVTDQDVLDLYAAVTGFDPAKPETDQGAYELDVLNAMRKRGLGREKDGTPHTIGAFAAVDWHDRLAFRAAHYACGGLKVCAGLPVSAQGQDVWDVVPGPQGKFGSWGGHSMFSFGYEVGGVWLWTWGRKQFATWAWVSTYVDECYAVISEDYLRGSGRTPQGLDVARLAQILADLPR